MIFAPLFVMAAQPLDVAINEVAWMGTQASPNDEWLELENNTATDISLAGWKITNADNSLAINLTGQIVANGFFLLERTDDSVISDTTMNQKYTGALGNDGESLTLFDKENKIIDSIPFKNGWPAGDNTAKKTMERISSTISGAQKNNWSNNNGITKNGKDSKGNVMLGTPRSQNSVSSANDSQTATSTTSPSPTPSSQPDNSATTTQPSSTPTPIPPAMIDYSSISLNEIMPNSSAKEWIELINNSDQPIDISGFKISDSGATGQGQKIPTGTSLDALAFYVLYFEKPIFNNDGDQIKLITPNDQVIQTVNYNKTQINQSAARDDAGRWAWTTTLTPGQKNIITKTSTTLVSKKETITMPDNVPIKSPPQPPPTQADQIDTPVPIQSPTATTTNAVTAAVTNSITHQNNYLPLIVFAVIIFGLIGGFILIKFIQ